MPSAPVIAAIDLEHGREVLALSGILAELLDAPLLVAAVSPGGAAPVRARASAELSDRPFEVRVLADKRQARELAIEESAAAIVFGQGQRGRFGQNRADEGLIERAGCPVAIAPAGYPQRAPHTVGCAFNATAESRAALALAARLAKRAGAKLQLLTCAEPPFLTPVVGLTYSNLMARKVEDAKRRARDALTELAPDAEAEVVAIEGEAADVLAERSRELDLLVCGSRTCGQLRALVVGSTSRRLVDSASCPVVVTPARDERQLSSAAEARS